VVIVEPADGTLTRFADITVRGTVGHPGVAAVE